MAIRSRVEWQKAVAIDRAMSQLAGQTAPNATSPWVVLLGVDLKENVETIQNFTTQFGLTYPLLLDRDGAVSEHYQVRGIPTTVFLDADGVVRARHVGPLTEDKFAEGS
jgi:peroxiredoxin